MGYERIRYNQVKQIMNRFNQGVVALSFMIGADQDSITYPTNYTDPVTTFADLFTFWQDKLYDQITCAGAYYNQIEQFDTLNYYCPLFTYFGKMSYYNIEPLSGSPETWTINSCIYRRNEEAVTMCNAFNNFRGTWEDVDQYTDTAFQTYGAYQPYLTDYCTVGIQLLCSRYHISIDPINSSIELSEEALEFQHQHQLYFCNLWKVTEYTIIGINDEEMNLFYEILSYEFTNNQNNLLDGSVSFFWNSLRKLTISGLFLSIQD